MIEWDIMGKSQIDSVADKIVALLADGRISQADWRLWIPRRITDYNKMIIANAKNLADGINEVIENEQIGLSKELIFDYQTGEYNGQ
jgi:hypothetical protein